jgi:hypothetical protein
MRRVVKNGSKTRPRMVSSIPMPLSLTVTRAYQPGARSRRRDRSSFEIGSMGVHQQPRALVVAVSKSTFYEPAPKM